MYATICSRGREGGKDQNKIAEYDRCDMFTFWLLLLMAELVALVCFVSTITVDDKRFRLSCVFAAAANATAEAADLTKTSAEEQRD